MATLNVGDLTITVSVDLAAETELLTDVLQVLDDAYEMAAPMSPLAVRLLDTGRRIREVLAKAVENTEPQA